MLMHSWEMLAFMGEAFTHARLKDRGCLPDWQCTCGERRADQKALDAQNGASGQCVCICQPAAQDNSPDNSAAAQQSPPAQTVSSSRAGGLINPNVGGAGGSSGFGTLGQSISHPTSCVLPCQEQLSCLRDFQSGGTTSRIGLEVVGSACCLTS